MSDSKCGGDVHDVPPDRADRVLVTVDDDQVTAGIREGDVRISVAFPETATRDDLADAFAELQREAGYVLDLQNGVIR